MDLNMKVGQRIMSLRKEKRLTMEKLAYTSDLSKGGLSEIERGMKEPKLSTILKLCNTLEISIQDFFDSTF